MNHLFSNISIRDIEFKNRIGMSPMCTYSATNGMANNWHLTHYTSRAVGGAAFIIQEATAVSPEGRISPADLGIWNDEQANALKTITESIAAYNCVPGIQLAHAGGKASHKIAWEGSEYIDEKNGGWNTIFAPSAIPVLPNHPTPKEMTEDDIDNVINNFVQAAIRAVAAGYKIIEIHAAHGYLLHQFLSPLTNKRTDSYGRIKVGDYKLLLTIVKEIRNKIPQNIILGVRLSVVDWHEAGWNMQETLYLANMLSKNEVDFIDCSSGGLAAIPQEAIGAGFNTKYSAEIKRKANLHTATVGKITNAFQADHIIRNEQADFVLIGRELLRNPYFPLQAAQQLGEKIKFPNQYLRAF